MTYTLTVDLPRPPLTSNDQRRAHWTKVRDAKATTETLVVIAAKNAQVPRIDYADITITWYAPDAKRRDPDALSPFLKASLDALVHAGVLEDDNSKFVRQVAMRTTIDRERPRIEIELKEVVE